MSMGSTEQCRAPHTGGMFNREARCALLFNREARYPARLLTPWITRIRGPTTRLRRFVGDESGSVVAVAEPGAVI